MNNATKISLSAVGLVMIAMLESYSPTPYKDGGGVVTNGFGNTHNANKPVTVPQALDQLQRNASEAGQAVTRCITSPLNQNEYDALVSFTFNVGQSAFCKSTLVKKFNAGDHTAGCNELSKWVYDNGTKVRGLAIRREKERALCLSNT